MGAEEGQLLAVQKERDHFREELGSATQLAAAAHSKHAMELEELQARVDQLEMDGEVLEEEAAGLRKKLAAASKAGGDSKRWLAIFTAVCVVRDVGRSASFFD